MREIKSREIERIESLGKGVEIKADTYLQSKKKEKEYKSSANTIISLLQGLKLKFYKEIGEEKFYTPTELTHMIEYILERAKVLPKELPKIEMVDNWKGNDELKINTTLSGDFILIGHIKDKKTGEVKEYTKEVLKKDISTIKYIINKMKTGETTNCKEIAKQLGYPSWKELWKERKEYFQSYYYPIKVLEALGIIEYSGRGGITKL